MVALRDRIERLHGTFVGLLYRLLVACAEYINRTKFRLLLDIVMNALIYEETARNIPSDFPSLQT